MSNKVNANTKELEFKRKHNNLCESVEEIPVVVANPTDNNGNVLEGIKIGDTKYKMPPNVNSATSGTIVDALGLNSEGNLVKGTISGGTKLYNHNVYLTASTTTTAIQASFYMVFISPNSTPFNEMNNNDKYNVATAQKTGFSFSNIIIINPFELSQVKTGIYVVGSVKGLYQPYKKLTLNVNYPGDSLKCSVFDKDTLDSNNEIVKGAFIENGTLTISSDTVTPL